MIETGHVLPPNILFNNTKGFHCNEYTIDTDKQVFIFLLKQEKTGRMSTLYINNSQEEPIVLMSKPSSLETALKTNTQVTLRSSLGILDSQPVIELQKLPKIPDIVQIRQTTTTNQAA